MSEGNEGGDLDFEREEEGGGERDWKPLGEFRRGGFEEEEEEGLRDEAGANVDDGSREDQDD